MQAFTKAVQLVVGELRTPLLALSEREKSRTYEVRLRAGAPVMLTTADGTRFVERSGKLCESPDGDLLRSSEENIRQTFLSLCDYSVLSHEKQIASGFLTIPGGHRAGICGKAVLSPEGKVQSLSSVTSINLRIARVIPGVSASLCDALFRDGLRSVIVAGPPSSGKTTLLRDMARRLSEGACGTFYRTSVMDSREEFGTLPYCDLFRGFRKADGIECALRSMAPQVIVCDEIATDRDVQALNIGFASGASFVVSMHAQNEQEIAKRKIFRSLSETGQFSDVVFLSADAPCIVRAVRPVQSLLP